MPEIEDISPTEFRVMVPTQINGVIQILIEIDPIGREAFTCFLSPEAANGLGELLIKTAQSCA
jgi:hypothetical protein